MAERRRAVIWTPGARDDLDEIITYIAKDSLPSALAFLEEALQTAESLATLSERGRVVPELNDPIVRELFIKRYRLLYEIHEQEVHVLAVLHGAREFKP
ncbi:MAG: type II toxin-antitoxin system RelE/ParE family toxin [Acidobacteria bacterium]|nr:MAG: type II toxin-antitoxin system RelE/ParE family toxin [Acidobacteriota bacterium]